MAVEIIATITDASGDTSTTSHKVNDPVLVGALTAYGIAWASLLDDLIHGVIRSVNAYVKASVSSLLNNTIIGTADVEHVAHFSFLAANGLSVDVNIPSMNEAIIDASTSDTLDQADLQVAAFITAMETGIAVTGGTISPCDIGESSITDTIFARESFRNSGSAR